MVESPELFYDAPPTAQSNDKNFKVIFKPIIRKEEKKIINIVINHDCFRHLFGLRNVLLL